MFLPGVPHAVLRTACFIITCGFAVSECSCQVQHVCTSLVLVLYVPLACMVLVWYVLLHACFACASKLMELACMFCFVDACMLAFVGVCWCVGVCLVALVGARMCA